MGRHRKKPAPGGWRKKLHPVFFELADLNQEFEKRLAKLQNNAKQNPQVAGRVRAPAELQNKISARILNEKANLEKWFEERLVDIDRRHKPISHNPIAYGYLTLDPPISDSEGLREYLHFHRYGEALRVTEAQDAAGNIDAWDKISRTERDLRILAFGKGPIAPFQEDVIHRQLLQLVICYERERLTAEELAECFDKYCACGKENHEADALRKMRDRFERELRAE